MVGGIDIGVGGFQRSTRTVTRLCDPSTVGVSVGFEFDWFLELCSNDVIGLLFNHSVDRVPVPRDLRVID